MTGKCYYLTTVAEWRKHAGRFANSHFIELTGGDNATLATPEDCGGRILVLVEADEGVHLTLEDDPGFEALPHPLAQKSISETALASLAARGVRPGATTFDVAEIAAGWHPLLRHRVF